MVVVVVSFFKCVFVLFFCINLFAQESTDTDSCIEATNIAMQKCHAASIVIENSCSVKSEDTTNRDALDLLNKYSKESSAESAQGVIIVKGSMYTDALRLHKQVASACKSESEKYLSQCSGLRKNIQSCEDSETSTNGNFVSLDKNLLNIAEAKVASAAENLSEISAKIDQLENEINKAAVELCKQNFDTLTKPENCDNPNAEFMKKADHSFASCSKENSSYDKLNCFSVIKPSLKGDYATPPQQASSNSQEISRTAASVTEKEQPIAQQGQEKLAAGSSVAVAQVAQTGLSQKNDKSGNQEKFGEVAFSKTSSVELENKNKSADFKMPSLATILKVATGAVLVYGLVTGKLKTWYNKFIDAFNPYSSSNSRSPTSSGGSSSAGGSGCYGTFSGTIDMPPQNERIIARDIKIRSMGKQVTGNPSIDNAATGGGSPDGGMFLTGSFSWETDVNCRVTSGTAIIFGHPFGITGTVNKDRTFNLSYLGPMPGYITSDNLIKGKLQHGGGEEYIYGILNGRFTPRK